MFADPAVNSSITIDGEAYTFLETPGAPEIVYAEIGKKAKVYRIFQPKEQQYYALKVFKQKYRNPSTVENTEKISVHSDLPGLAVSRRTILTPEKHSELLASQPHLAYAVLMPWIEGKSWSNFVSARTSLLPDQCFRLAITLGSIMAALEERGLAHCDLSSSNFIITSDFTKVELVDIEEMFGVGLDQPPDVLAGTSGYAPDWVKQCGLWEAGADRFSLGVLLSEILAWQFEDIRSSSEGDAFFADGEFGNKSKRFKLMSERLNEISPRFSRLFQTVWYAESVEECPRILEWKQALDRIELPTLEEKPVDGLSTPHDGLQAELKEAIVESTEKPVQRSALPDKKNLNWLWALGGMAMVAIVLFIAILNGSGNLQIGIGKNSPINEATKVINRSTAQKPYPTAIPIATSTRPRPTSTIAPPLGATNFLSNIKVMTQDTLSSKTSLQGQESTYVRIINGQLVLIPANNPEDSYTGYSFGTYLDAGQGIIISFIYEDGSGWEAFLDHGDWWTDGYRRLGITIENLPKTNLWQGKIDIGESKPLERTFTPKPDKWYFLMLVVKSNGSLMAAIWDPQDTSRMVTYQENLPKWAGLRWNFAAGIWAGKVQFDNFMMISFSE